MSWFAVGAAVVAGVSALSQANSEKQAADANAKMAKVAAVVENQQAGQQEESQRRRARQILGMQRAALGQSGIGLDGSARDIMDESAATAEYDALTIRYEGALRSRGLNFEASQEKFEGRNAMRQGYLKAGGSLLSGYGSYLGNKSSSGTA